MSQIAQCQKLGGNQIYMAKWTLIYCISQNQNIAYPPAALVRKNKKMGNPLSSPCPPVEGLLSTVPQRITESPNHEGICTKAPATLGLMKSSRVIEFLSEYMYTILVI